MNKNRKTPKTFSPVLKKHQKSVARPILARPLLQKNDFWPVLVCHPPVFDENHCSVTFSRPNFCPSILMTHQKFLLFAPVTSVT